MVQLIKYSIIRKIKNFNIIFWPCIFPLLWELCFTLDLEICQSLILRLFRPDM